MFINSTQGLRADPNAGAYAASKSALRAFAGSFRSEVNVEGVRVLGVFTGSTATSMQQRIHSQTSRSYRPERLIQPSDVALRVASAVRFKSAEVVELTMRPTLPSLPLSLGPEARR